MPVQHACAQHECLQACTSEADSSGASIEQDVPRVAGGAGCRGGEACDAGAEASEPGAEGRRFRQYCRAALGIGGSQRSSRSDETIKTDSPGEQGEVHGQMQRTGVYSSALRRVVKGVGGALSVTRAVADATVERARRLFFRDAG